MQKRVIVVKIGGSTLGTHDTTLEDLVELQQQGECLVVVHGGAKVTSEWLARLGIPTSFIKGLSVTDTETLKVVTAALSGLVNKELVVVIQSLGGKAVSLSGCDGNLLQANIKSRELGYVGEIVQVRSELLQQFADLGLTIVLSPISLGIDGLTYNVNADEAASAVALTMNATQLDFVSNVPGILRDGTVIPKLSPSTANELIAEGIISGGMIPKVHAALEAVNLGVQQANIVDLAGLASGGGTQFRASEEGEG